MPEDDENLSCEEMDSDDMAGGLCDSDSDNGENRRAVFKAYRMEKKALEDVEDDPDADLAAPPSKFVQEFDTNVFKFKLDCLENKSEMLPGKPIICKESGAVFCNISKIDREGE